MADNSSNNTCVICLEPLATDTIGTSVACGHCFHEKCWNGWKQSSAAGNNRHRNPKCPMCNKVSNQFCKIFIDFNAILERDPFDNNHDKDDDDDNLSWSSDNVGEKNQQQSVVDDEQRPPPPNFVDLVDDDTDDDEALGEKAKLYKAKSKSLKRQIKAIQFNQSRKDEEISKLKEKYGALQAELNTCKEKQEERQKQHEANCLALEKAKETLQTKSRALKEARTRKKNLEHEYSKAFSDLSIMKKNGDAAIRKASSQNMPEVKRALEEYPKVLRDITKLEAENTKLQAYLERLQQRHTASLHQQKSSSSSSKPMAAQTADRALGSINAKTTKENHHYHGNSTTNKKKAAKVLLREMERQREQEELSRQAAAEEVERVNRKRKMKSHLSEHAARMGMMEQQQSRNRNRSLHAAAAAVDNTLDSLALLDQADSSQESSSAASSGVTKRSSGPLTSTTNNRSGAGVNLSFRPNKSKRPVGRQVQQKLSFFRRR